MYYMYPSHMPSLSRNEFENFVVRQFELLEYDRQKWTTWQITKDHPSSLIFECTFYIEYNAIVSK